MQGVTTGHAVQQGRCIPGRRRAGVVAPYKSSVVQFFSWMVSSSSRSSLDRPSTCFYSWRTLTVLLILISLTEWRWARALASFIQSRLL